MNTYVLIGLAVLIAVLVYAAIGIGVRAAYLCYHTDERGYVKWNYEDNANPVGIFWPIVLVYFSIIYPICSCGELCGRASNKLHNLCFRLKHGEDIKRY